MSSQYDQPQQSSKWRQYIGPVIILVLAVGLAIYGLVWASNEENALPTEETTTEDAGDQRQPDAGSHLEQVQQDYPDASPEEQEALAAAQAEADTYIVSEHLLQELLTNPEYDYGFSQEAAEFAVENIEVDWNEQAAHFAALAREEYPDATDEEIENLLRDEPGGPQFTAEQTEYAMSQLN
ncbi:hypothetical protein GCM10023190_26550 [Enteractinococcus fodinae]|uniref:Host cell surface-exposed lipoprotein n=1 Tax=Enteractinococcus fodinae TaxID=684663 RepID=A0ABU2B1V4_9MICC|nr:hypothetical protein [Enteractinococcus fodinae]MDR7347585.1 hypothetical protein [Enteractinococcus fodinae]